MQGTQWLLSRIGAWEPGRVTFAELFGEVLSRPASDPSAFAGVQDKVSGRRIALPVAHAGGSFLLKLDPPEYPHLVANEAFFLGAARASGIRVADYAIIRDIDGNPGLVVRRFDRQERAGAIVRLAQEDACQVLGRYPADKYRLTAEELIGGLAERSGAPPVAARTLIEQFAFAFLSGNGDLHGKNASLLERDGEWRVAPAYDLPSTLPYGDTSMALPIAGKDREDLGRADFVALGASVDVPEKAVARVLDRIVDAAPPGSRESGGCLPMGVGFTS